MHVEQTTGKQAQLEEKYLTKGTRQEKKKTEITDAKISPNSILCDVVKWCKNRSRT
jgi:hypothetical protein